MVIFARLGAEASTVSMVFARLGAEASCRGLVQRLGAEASVAAFLSPEVPHGFGSARPAR